MRSMSTPRARRAAEPRHSVTGGTRPQHAAAIRGISSRARSDRKRIWYKKRPAQCGPARRGTVMHTFQFRAGGIPGSAMLRGAIVLFAASLLRATGAPAQALRGTAGLT